MYRKTKETRKKSKIANAIILIILLIGVYYAYKFYQKNNFNDFVKSELNLYTSEFTRDEDEKYSDKRSYKITSEEFNDAMFYKTIKVTPNTPYKVTCMVKTKNVESENNKKGAGAQISIEGTTERSIAIEGTTDWKQIEFIFNSKNREEVNLGFRLGGYVDNCKGEAWFSDFKLEEGIQDNSSEWKFACLIFENTDVIVDVEEVKLNMTTTDITDISRTIDRFEDSCYDLSQGKMSANCDIYRIQEPINQLSYDEEFGYYVAPENVEEQISKIINSENDYDHIFVIIRLGNDQYQDEIQIKDWIGLGAMDYYGIGFSNIRLPNNSNSYIYKYNTRINTFPEEVFLHEFLHSLERTAQEYGYKIPELHDYEKYGYENEPLEGQKKWYTDYMNKNIKAITGNIGLPNEIYTLKPAKSSNFEYSYEIEEFTEPENIIEVIREICLNIGGKINTLLGGIEN